MSRLFLLRHAKAGWAEPGMRDFDRPLDAAGQGHAEATGIAMRNGGYVPELVICSTARRARQTLEGVIKSLRTGRIVYTDGLYNTDAAGYVDIIRDAPAVGSILVVGHNPMTEDVALALSGDGVEEARHAMVAGFPTSALAVIRFPGAFAQAAPGRGYLETFLTPADL
ncbi:phosphoglycerate mutase [Mesorhizobium sp. L-8-10]|uniref:SixA phosphatase family protein n=1 Tax=unclassified Mesorhizobium TaxID=325217 RepID=UPI001928EC92|nr:MULTISPECIES: histidine phosphatase family protein [unclassified Mesorhizobium]BCH24692.1 phosphoglycerate mutase [Mesorhizobium sp. L-8-3]BCH32428.1 phosphoglycerate mutase [Mesorhizobium sp. L-8-10]